MVRDHTCPCVFHLPQWPAIRLPASAAPSHAADFARERGRFESGKRRFPPLLAQLFGFDNEVRIFDAVDWRAWGDSSGENAAAGYQRALIRSAASTSSATLTPQLPDALRYAAKVASLSLEVEGGVAARAQLLKDLASLPRADLPDLPPAAAEALQQADLGSPQASVAADGAASVARRPMRERRPVGAGLQSAASRPFCSWEHEEWGPPVFDPANYPAVTGSGAVEPEEASAAEPSAAARPRSAKKLVAPAASSPGPGLSITATHLATLQHVGWVKQASYPWWPCIVVHPAELRGLPPARKLYQGVGAEDRILVRYFLANPDDPPAFFAVSAAKGFRTWLCAEQDGMAAALRTKEGREDADSICAAAAAEHAKPVAARMGAAPPSSSTADAPESVAADDEAGASADAAAAAEEKTAKPLGDSSAAAPTEASRGNRTEPTVKRKRDAPQAPVAAPSLGAGDVAPTAAANQRAAKPDNSPVIESVKAEGPNATAGQKRRRSVPAPGAAARAVVESDSDDSVDDAGDDDDDEDEPVLRPSRSKPAKRPSPAGEAAAPLPRRASAVAALSSIKAKMAPPPPRLSATRDPVPSVDVAAVAPVLASTTPEAIAAADGLATRLQASLADPAAVLALLEGPLSALAVSVALLRASKLLPFVRQHLLRFTPSPPQPLPSLKAGPPVPAGEPPMQTGDGAPASVPAAQPLAAGAEREDVDASTSGAVSQESVSVVEPAAIAPIPEGPTHADIAALSLRIRTIAAALVESWKKACASLSTSQKPPTAVVAPPSREEDAAPARAVLEAVPVVKSGSAAPKPTAVAPLAKPKAASKPSPAASSGAPPPASFRDFMKQVLAPSAASSAATSASTASNAAVVLAAQAAAGSGEPHHTTSLQAPENAALWAAWHQEPHPMSSGRGAAVDVLAFEFQRAIEASKALESATAGMSATLTTFMVQFVGSAAKAIATAVEARLYDAAMLRATAVAEDAEDAYSQGARAALLCVIEAVDSKLKAHHDISGRLGGLPEGLSERGALPRHLGTPSTVADLLALLLEIPGHVRLALISGGPSLLASAHACLAMGGSGLVTQPPDAVDHSHEPFSALKRDIVRLVGQSTKLVAELLARVAGSAAGVNTFPAGLKV